VLMRHTDAPASLRDIDTNHKYADSIVTKHQRSFNSNFSDEHMEFARLAWRDETECERDDRMERELGDPFGVCQRRAGEN
jgi:hypothetical protein